VPALGRGAVAGQIHPDGGEKTEVRRGAAEKLIAIAREAPHLVHKKWGECARAITHTDLKYHYDGPSQDFCGTVNDPQGNHEDRGLLGLTFPPKPTDF
jgi:hypothetical protein